MKFFDDLCRVIASPLPRREVFRLILASLVAAVAPSSRLAAAKRVDVKREVIDINVGTRVACLSQLANRPARVKCPPGTEKFVIVKQGCTQIWVGRNDRWVAQVVVECTKPPVSPP
jgi:hypothetical protein